VTAATTSKAVRPLHERTIVVTGGSLGIGFEIAKTCARAGATIVIGALPEGDQLNDAVTALREISTERHMALALDVTSVDSVAGFRAAVQHAAGIIHGLVNNAGVFGPIGLLQDTELDAFVQTWRVNFFGVVAMCRAFLPLLSRAPRGKIVNLAGGGASAPLPRYSSYATSKAAVVRFTENLAVESADIPLDVNAVAPGFVNTRLHNRTLEAGEAAGTWFLEYTKRQIETGGEGAESAANLTAWLLSDGADGISGKFLSSRWDPWETAAFQERLRTERDLATLRRIDDKTFYKRP
jgi:3-oxoacyl-[acyl-carrier protein] reductase